MTGYFSLRRGVASIMSVQISQVKGDIIELIFNPKQHDLRVGHNLTIREKDNHRRGLVVQVIEFKMVTYPSLVREQLRLVLDSEQGISQDLMEYLAEAQGEDFSELRNLKVAIAKIRKLTGPRWDQWDGWITTRNVEIEITNDKEVFQNCIPDYGNRLYLGKTLQGVDFHIEGQSLEKVNIITGVKGSGKSHLAKVLLLQLIEQGAPCVVFDINKEYIKLPPHKVEPVTGKTLQKGIVHLKAGGNLKLGVRQFGLSPLVTMLTKFGLPEVSAMYFENRVSRILEETARKEKFNKNGSFLSIENLIQMADRFEFAANEVVNGAIRSRLEAIKNTGVFASGPEDAISLREEYNKIIKGGALIIDISGLSNQARTGFVQSIIQIIKEICEQELEQRTDRFPFIFFEEAHLYINRNTIGYIVTRARHLGITSFFVTNMVGALDETVLRQVDNLFITRLPFEDDVRHLGKSAMTDQETLTSFVKRLRNHHCLVMGNSTHQYPLIIRVDGLNGINTAGETQYFFKPKNDTSNTPPGFGEFNGKMGNGHFEKNSNGKPTAKSTPSESSEQSLEQLWNKVVETVRKKKVLLGSILSQGTPVEIKDDTLIVRFPKESKFCEEVLEIPECKKLLEEEVAAAFKLLLKIVCINGNGQKG